MRKMLNSNLGLGSVNEALQLCKVKLTHRSQLEIKKYVLRLPQNRYKELNQTLQLQYLIYRQAKAPTCTQIFHSVPEQRLVFST
jgi:hypothetical protein